MWSSLAFNRSANSCLTPATVELLVHKMTSYVRIIYVVRMTIRFHAQTLTISLDVDSLKINLRADELKIGLYVDEIVCMSAIS